MSSSSTGRPSMVQTSAGSLSGAPTLFQGPSSDTSMRSPRLRSPLSTFATPAQPARRKTSSTIGRVVAGLAHQEHADAVGLCLMLPRVREHAGNQTELAEPTVHAEHAAEHA